MKQLEVKIMGQSYLLGCPDGGDARMLDAVNRVDIAMCKIRDAGKIKARDRIAVLAALNLAFELSEAIAEQFAQPLQPIHVNPSAAPILAGSSDSRTSQLPLEELLHRLDAALGTDGQLL